MKSARLGRFGSSAAGFTLIELMVVVVVATILITIAVPAYTSQMRKSRRTEAKTALLELAAREQRYFSTNGSYTNVPANLGYTGTFPQAVGSGYYQVSVCVAAALPCAGAAATGTAFALTATPTGTQALDTQCGTYTLDDTGAQAVSGSDAASTCWN